MGTQHQSASVEPLGRTEPGRKIGNETPGLFECGLCLVGLCLDLWPHFVIGDGLQFVCAGQKGSQIAGKPGIIFCQPVHFVEHTLVRFHRSTRLF